jgi:hypothetical protein
MSSEMSVENPTLKFWQFPSLAALSTYRSSSGLRLHVTHERLWIQYFAEYAYYVTLLSWGRKCWHLSLSIGVIF